MSYTYLNQISETDASYMKVFIRYSQLKDTLSFFNEQDIKKYHIIFTD